MKLLQPILFSLLLLTCICAGGQVITTVAGVGTVGYSGDGGTAINAQFNNPISVALDGAGNMYISDFYNHRIRKVNISNGVVTTIAGNGTAGFSGDGGAATAAQINNPSDLCVDGAGNIYFIDNQNFRVRKIHVTTGIISTVAGSGLSNYSGETTPAISAGLHSPAGLALDGSGNLYISLTLIPRICIVNLATGILSTIAGNGAAGFGGDGGPAMNASFWFPTGLAVSTTGDVFVADYNNNRIRKISAAGIVTTIAGDGLPSFAGDNGPANTSSLNHPTGVAVDAAGNIFIADRINYRIRKVTAATGIITTVAGSGVFGYGGDGGLATSPCVKLADPHKVRVDAAGNLFISDQSNSRIRKVDITQVPTTTPTISISTGSPNVCSNTPVTFNATINNATSPVFQWKVNGNNAGTNIPSFTISTLNNGDVVTCQLTASAACGVPVTITSNAIVMAVTPSVTPTIVITADATTVCSGNPITFNATITNGGSNPVYQWQVDGFNAGVNLPIFILSNPSSNTVRCVLTSNATCAVPVNQTSNSITVTGTSTVTPEVSITASATQVCAGATVTFNAQAVDAGNNPSYQWYVNSIQAGTNSPVFSTSNLADGDVVSCIVTADPALTCVTSSTAPSNQLEITVTQASLPTITITASKTNICPGEQVTFAATVQQAGNTPTYQWQVDGVNTGTNAPQFITASLADGDQVQCILTTGAAACNTTVVSNNVPITVKNGITITITPQVIVVAAGSQVQLTANITGSLDTYTWSPATQLVDATVLDPVTTPVTGTVTYTLSATSTDGCTATQQATVKMSNQFLMPSGFTPNNDGKNDIFRIPHDVIFELTEFSIFDRWGNRVFYTKDISKGWDGYYKGMESPVGVYIYMVRGNTDKGAVSLKGTVVLIR